MNLLIRLLWMSHSSAQLVFLRERKECASPLYLKREMTGILMDYTKRGTSRFIQLNSTTARDALKVVKVNCGIKMHQKVQLESVYSSFAMWACIQRKQSESIKTNWKLQHAGCSPCR